MKTKRMVETKIMKEEAAEKAIVAMIRQASEAGQLIAEPEILRRAAEQHLLTSPAADPAEEVSDILKKVVDGCEDVHELTAEESCRHYYSSQFMTQPYALMLLQKEGDPLRLIAEIVRQNSEIYPRPVPLDLFTQPPFDLTHQEALNRLERIAIGEEYGDIAVTTTSTSRVFLYSTLHLEPDHASMLAEWIDVGQSNNP
jgi:hypothetical protein